MHNIGGEPSSGGIQVFLESRKRRGSSSGSVDQWCHMPWSIFQESRMMAGCQTTFIQCVDQDACVGIKIAILKGVHDLGLLTVCGLVFSSRIRLNQVLPGNQRASQGGYFVILNFMNMSIINSKFCGVSLHQKVAPPQPESHWQSLRLLWLFSHIEHRMRCGNPRFGNPCDFWRKFRSQTSNTMDRWKAEVGRVTEEKGIRKKINNSNSNNNNNYYNYNYNYNYYYYYYNYNSYSYNYNNNSWYYYYYCWYYHCYY